MACINTNYTWIIVIFFKRVYTSIILVLYEIVQFVKYFWNIAGIVRELTDEKSLPKLQRKAEQIKHAPHASPKAKLVKLADKLYNLRDLIRQTPEGWTEQRVQEYFVWAAKVVRGLRGSNNFMEDALDALFKERNIDTATLELDS